MALNVLRGERRAADRKALLYAISRAPALVIDCANCADPHALFPALSQERLHDVHIIEVDLLYCLRDALLRVREFAEKKGISTVAVTSVGRLFHYHDEAENRNILEHCWELIEGLSMDFDIAVSEEGTWGTLSRASA